MHVRITKYRKHISHRTRNFYEHYHAAVRVDRVHDEPQMQVHLELQVRGRFV